MDQLLDQSRYIYEFSGFGSFDFEGMYHFGILGKKANANRPMAGNDCLSEEREIFEKLINGEADTVPPLLFSSLLNGPKAHGHLRRSGESF
jgi:hypothetical protein